MNDNDLGIVSASSIRHEAPHVCSSSIANNSCILNSTIHYYRTLTTMVDNGGIRKPPPRLRLIRWFVLRGNQLRRVDPVIAYYGKFAPHAI
jgi:hypothetical protein